MAFRIAAPTRVDVGATRDLEALDVDRRVADDAAVVDHDIGDLVQTRQALGARLLGGGVAEAGHRDDGRAGGARCLGELGGDRVPSRVRGDDEDVAAGDRVVGEQGFGEPGHSFERGAQQCARMKHQAFEQDRIDADETARPVVQLLGEDVRVPGPEGVDRAAARQRISDEVGRAIDVRPLTVQQPLDEVSRELEVAPSGGRAGRRHTATSCRQR